MGPCACQPPCTLPFILLLLQPPVPRLSPSCLSQTDALHLDSKWQSSSLPEPRQTINDDLAAAAEIVRRGTVGGRGVQGRGRSSSAFLQLFGKVGLMLSSRDGEQSTRTGSQEQPALCQPPPPSPQGPGYQATSSRAVFGAHGCGGGTIRAKPGACRWTEDGHGEQERHQPRLPRIHPALSGRVPLPWI